MMSSSSILLIIQTQITRYGLSILMILGNIGNILTVSIFYRRRKNACAMYLLCASVMNSITLTLNGIISVYSLDHGDPSALSLGLCKFRFYFGHVSGQIGRYLVIVACIDRYMSITNYAHARFINQPTISRYIIGIVTLFWFIISIHIAILATITNGVCAAFGVYYIVYQVYTIIVIGLLPPILMILLGFLAYYNMRKLHTRIRPIVTSGNNNSDNNNNNSLVDRRDWELLVMVVTEAIVYALTTIPYPFVALEIAVTNHMGIDKSIEHRQIENLLISVTLLLLLFNCASRFYIYLSVSKAFRRDFSKLFIKIRRPIVE